MKSAERCKNTKQCITIQNPSIPKISFFQKDQVTRENCIKAAYIKALQNLQDFIDDPVRNIGSLHRIIDHMIYFKDEKYWFLSFYKKFPVKMLISIIDSDLDPQNKAEAVVIFGIFSQLDCFRFDIFNVDLIKITLELAKSTKTKYSIYFSTFYLKMIETNPDVRDLLIENGVLGINFQNKYQYMFLIRCLQTKIQIEENISILIQNKILTLINILTDDEIINPTKNRSYICKRDTVIGVINFITENPLTGYDYLHLSISEFVWNKLKESNDPKILISVLSYLEKYDCSINLFELIVHYLSNFDDSCLGNHCLKILSSNSKEWKQKSNQVLDIITSYFNVCSFLNKEYCCTVLLNYFTESFLYNNSFIRCLFESFDTRYGLKCLKFFDFILLSYPQKTKSILENNEYYELFEKLIQEDNQKSEIALKILNDINSL